METANELRMQRNRLLHLLVRDALVRERERGHPISVRTPEEEIPDTPLDEFEEGIEEFFEA